MASSGGRRLDLASLSDLGQVEANMCKSGSFNRITMRKEKKRSRFKATPLQRMNKIQFDRFSKSQANFKSSTTTREVLTIIIIIIMVLLLSVFEMQPIHSEPTLEVTKFQVPARALLGKTNRLICQYQLRGLSLHAMKLFKDNNEFYRYLPPNRQLERQETKLVFEVPGVRVDERRSNATQVLIGPLTKQSSGLYKCQVSIEDTFKSVSAERRMEVVTAQDQQQMMGAPAGVSGNKKQLATTAFQQQQQSGSIPPSSFFKQEPKSLVQSRQHSRPTTNINSNNNNNQNNHLLPSESAAASTNFANPTEAASQPALLVTFSVSSLILIIINYPSCFW